MARRILVFDSGIGGLGITEEILSIVPPDVSIDYLADTALFPYGEQPDIVLIDRIVALLGAAKTALRPDLIVIACNTASTLALNALRQNLDIPFVGCVPPIRWAARLSQTRTIGLLATKATVRRPYLEELRAEYAPDCTLVAHGARHLADLAERAFRGQEIALDLLRPEVDALFGQPAGDKIDVVAIGCTHYTFLLDQLRKASPVGTIWLDPANAVARQAISVLEARIPSTEQSTDTRGRAFFTATPDGLNSLESRVQSMGYDGVALFAP